MKKLIVYYSLEGSTRAAAEAMADEIGADVLGIKPVNELRAKGFWRFFWGGMSAKLRLKPELEPYELDARSYDLILIGTPVWASSMTPPIRSWLTKTDLKHKAVAFFCTYKGSGGQSLADMQEIADGADVLGDAGFGNVLRDGDAVLLAARAWAREMLDAFADPGGQAQP